MGCHSNICKAQHKFTGEWIIGQLFIDKEYEPGYYIILTHKEYGITYVPIKPDTICYVTDMFDKNHNPIFEHDIIKYSYESWGMNDSLLQVEWYDRMWRTYDGEYHPLHYLSPIHTEVVGNIFINPEIITTFDIKEGD